MFLEDIDFSKPIPQPQLFLCKNNIERTTIANLSEAFNIELNLKFGGVSELNFSVPFQIDSNNELIKNPNINKLLYKYIIKIKLDSYEDYFIIDKPKDNMSDSDDVKNITCYSLAYELKDKNIRNYVVEAKSINQLFNGFTEDGITYSSILSETNWVLGYTDVDAQILYRGFSVSSKTLLDFLFEIAETFSCIIIFDNKNKVINFYDPLKLGTYKGLTFSYGLYLQNMDYEPDYDNVCTHLKLFGKDDITINEYNSTGTNFLTNYSLFLYPFERDENKNVLKSSLYFTDSLSNTILDYQDLVNSKDTEFTTLIEQKEVKQDELTILDNSLNTLLTELDVIQDNFDIAQANGDDTSALLIEKQNKQIEIDNKQIEIDNKQIEIDNIDLQIASLRSVLSMENNFTVDQITEINNYIIVKELSNDSITNSKDLIEYGKKEFIKIIAPILNIKINTVNLLALFEEQDKWDKFLPTNLGDIIKIYYEKMDIEIEAKIVEFNFNFEEQECTLSISNSKKISDDKQKFIENLNKAISTSTTVDMNKYNISEIPQLTSEINQIINNKWNANKNAIISGTNENYTLDRHGLTLKSPIDELNFLRALHNILAFTNDGGNTYKNALTPLGLIAEVIFGKLLCGVNLQIDASDTQGNKTFTVDQNGIEISGLALTITNGGIPQDQLSDSTQSLITNALQTDKQPPDLSTPTLTAINDGTIKISIAKPIDTDLSGFNIWRNTPTNNSTTATLIKSLTTTSITCPSLLEYIDTNTISNTPYYYWVSAYDTQSNETNKIATTPISITALDTIRPSRPTNLIIKGGWGRIDLSWTAPIDKDIAKYRIQISNFSDFSVIASTIDTNITGYTDFDRTYISIRYYRIYSIDINNNISIDFLSGNGQAVIAGDNTPPNAPSVPTITSDSNGRLIITFKGSGSSDASRYRIIRHTCNSSDKTGDDNGIDIGIINHLGGITHKYIDSYLDKIKYYYYQVYTIDNSGMSSSTALTIPTTGTIQAVDNTPPNIPTISGGESKIGGITIYWNSVTDAVSYNVYRYDSDGVSNEMYMANVSQLQFTDNSMSINVSNSYQYKISAVDSWGNISGKSNLSGSFSSMTPYTASDTTAPTIGTINDPIANDDGSITLSWSGYTDELSGVGGYNIWRILSTQTFDDKELIYSVRNYNITSYTDTTTIHNTTYKYTITCFDNAGNQTAIEENLANWKQITANDIIDPSAPSDLIISGGIGTIMLNWTKPEDLDIANYRIWVSDYSDFNIYDIVNTSQTSYTDTNRDTFNNRYYRIYTIDRAGNKSWDEITVPSTGYISGSGQTAIPGDGAPPSQLPTIDNINTKCNYNGSITITWIPNENPDGDLAKYKIFRSEDGTNFYNIAEVDNFTTNYTNTGLNNGQGYYYKLSCVDYSGMESIDKTESTNILYAIDNDAPPLPNDLSATGDLGAIKLLWTETEKGALYDIYRLKLLPEDELEYTKIITIPGSTGDLGKLMFIDYDPPTNTASTWYYKLKVSDQWGNASEFTDSVSATSTIVFDGNVTGNINGVPATTINSLIINSNNPYFEKDKLFWSDSYVGMDIPNTNVGTIVSGVGSWGTNVLEITGEKRLYYSKAIPIDINRTYKIRFKTRQTVLPTVGGRFMQSGLIYLDSNYNYISIAAICPNIAANNTSWQTIENIVSPNTVNVFPTNTVYVRPFFLVNATDGNGTAQIDGLDFFDITESYNAQVTANNSVQQGIAYSNGFKFDPSANGTGLSVTLGGTGTYSNKIRSIFNATEGIKIQNRPTILSGEEVLGNAWSNAVDQLKIDTDGNLLLSGKIQIGDTFSVTPTGVLNATGATIAGNVDITGTLKIAGTNILDTIDGKITSAGLNSTVNSDINQGKTARSYFDSNGNLIMSHLASITWDKVDTTGATASDVGARPDTWTPTASDVGAVANNQTAVFNTLTNNATLPGLFMNNGQLYINANYINTGILTSVTIDVDTDAKIGNNLILSPSSYSGVQWGEGINTPVIYVDSTPDAGGMHLVNPGHGIYANGIRIDQTPIATFG